MKSWFHFSSAFCSALLLTSTVFTSPAPGDPGEQAPRLSASVNELLEPSDSVNKLLANLALQKYDQMERVLRYTKLPPDFFDILPWNVAASQNDRRPFKIFLDDPRIICPPNVQRAFIAASQYRSYDALQYLISTYEEMLPVTMLLEAIEAHHPYLRLNFTKLLETATLAGDLEAVTRLFGIMDTSALEIALEDAVRSKKNDFVNMFFIIYRGNLPINYDKVLGVAVFAQNYDSIQTILEFKRPPTDISGIPALNAAVKKNDLNAISILLGESQINFAYTFVKALYADPDDVLRYVIRINQNFQHPMTYVSAMYGSLRLQNSNVVQMILEEYQRGLPIDYEDLLIISVRHKSYASMEAILKFNLPQPGFSVQTAFEAAASANDWLAIEILIRNSPPACFIDMEPIMSKALEARAKEVIQYLIGLNPQVTPPTYVKMIHQVVCLRIDFPLASALSDYNADPPINYEYLLAAAVHGKNYEAMHIILQFNRLPSDFTVVRALVAAEETGDLVARQILNDHVLANYFNFGG